MGITNGLASGIFVPLISNTLASTTSVERQFELSLFVMACLGAGEIFGGFTIAHIIKTSLSHELGLIFHTYLSIIGFSILLAFTALYEFNYLAYLFAFVFGIMDSASNTHIGMICGFEFEGYSVEAMGIFFIVKPFGICISVLIESTIVGRNALLTYFSVCLCIYLFAYILMIARFPFKEVRQIPKRVKINSSNFDFT